MQEMMAMMEAVKAEAAAAKAASEQAQWDAEAKVQSIEEQAVQKEMEEKARREAEEQAWWEAEEKNKRETADKASKDAEEQARWWSDDEARKAAEEQVRVETEAAKQKAEDEAAVAKAQMQEAMAAMEAAKAESEAAKAASEQAYVEAAAKVRSIEEQTAQKEAEEKARREAEEQAKKEAAEKAKKKAQRKASADAEEQVRREAEDHVRKAAEEQAHKEEIAQAVKAAEEAARKEARAREKQMAKKAAEEQAEREAEEMTRREQEEADRMFERFETTRKNTADLEAAKPKPKAKAKAKKKKDVSPFAGGPDQWKEMEQQLAREQEEDDAKRMGVDGPWVRKYHSPQREAARNPHIVADTKAEVERIYRKHCPEKLDKVDGLLAKFRGEEEVLLAKVRKKYNEMPAASVVPAVATKGSRTSALPTSGGVWQSVSKAKGGRKGTLGSKKKSSASGMKKHNSSAMERKELSSYWVGRARDGMHGELFRFEKLRKVWKLRACLICNGGAADGGSGIQDAHPVFVWLTAGEELGNGRHKDVKGEIVLTNQNRGKVSVQRGGLQKQGQKGTYIHTFNIITSAIEPGRVSGGGGSVAHTFGALNEAEMERWVRVIEEYSTPKQNLGATATKVEI
jgi:hypothetical protein